MSLLGLEPDIAAFVFPPYYDINSVFSVLIMIWSVDVFVNAPDMLVRINIKKYTEN